MSFVDNLDRRAFAGRAALALTGATIIKLISPDRANAAPVDTLKSSAQSTFSEPSIFDGAGAVVKTLFFGARRIPRSDNQIGEATAIACRNKEIAACERQTRRDSQAAWELTQTLFEDVDGNGVYTDNVDNKKGPRPRLLFLVESVENPNVKAYVQVQVNGTVRVANIEGNKIVPTNSNIVVVEAEPVPGITREVNLPDGSTTQLPALRLRATRVVGFNPDNTPVLNSVGTTLYSSPNCFAARAELDTPEVAIATPVPITVLTPEPAPSNPNCPEGPGVRCNVPGAPQVPSQSFSPELVQNDRLLSELEGHQLLKAS